MLFLTPTWRNFSGCIIYLSRMSSVGGREAKGVEPRSFTVHVHQTTCLDNFLECAAKILVRALERVRKMIFSVFSVHTYDVDRPRQ
jgi:hypothetical protein